VFAAIHRYHPEYSANILPARSQVSTLRRLLPRQSTNQKAYCKLLAKQRKLTRKQPSKICGRHIFVSDLCKVVKRRLGKFASRCVQNKIFEMHVKRYEALAADRLKDLKLRARVRVAEKKA
jgi:hypothetical protein